MSNKLIVSVSPHIYSGDNSAKIMWTVTLSLLPAATAAVLIFGIASLWVMLICVLSAVLTEAVIQKLRRTNVTVFDGSAALTGLLLAFCLPAGVPLWLAAVGSFVAIAVGKQAFGGLGQNIFNPALVGRAFLLAAWPTHMTAWISPKTAVDAVSSATPLASGFADVSYWDLLSGNRAGSLGEVCILALLAGALFLLIMGCISLRCLVGFLEERVSLAGRGYFRFCPAGLSSAPSLWLRIMLPRL